MQPDYLTELPRVLDVTIVTSALLVDLIVILSNRGNESGKNQFAARGNNRCPVTFPRRKLEMNNLMVRCA
jgi:hypothetical protein